MEKKAFVEISPAYYALAIAAYLRREAAVAAENQIQSFYEHGSHTLLLHRPIFAAAIEWLSNKGMVHVSHDPFGPSIYSATGTMEATWRELIKDSNLPFYKYGHVRDGRAWIESALLKLNETFEQLSISESDFENPDADWEPLPLDQNDPQLKEVISSVEATLQKVLADNGYNVTFPEERNYVVDGLRTALRTLTTASSTSGPYIQKYLLEPLAVLMRRFKDAALSVAASATKDLIVEYCKKHGAEWIARIFG